MRTLNDLISGFRDSDRTAIIDRKEYRRFCYTYKELYALSLKFASFLKKNDIKKGDRIIVWAYNGTEYAVILLGAFMEGVIVVPVDLRSNLDLVKKIDGLVNAKIIFQTRYKPKLKNKKIVFIEQIIGILSHIKISSVKKEKSPAIIQEDDIAEIIYTSGTTGKPKGVILTHKNLVSDINALNKIEKIDSMFRFLSVLPLSHVFEQMVGFFIPLSNKSTIVYIKSLKASALFKAFNQEKITNAVMVPRLLQLIYSGIIKKVKDKNKEKQFNLLLRFSEKLPFGLRKILFRKIHHKFGNRINYFMCGGAPLDRELERFYNATGFLILQGYGLTETSPVLTANTSKEWRLGSVGKPVPGVDIMVDKNKEILAKGDSITKGYFRDPKKTKELFKGSWLRTGDTGYMDKDSFLFLKGRKKDMILTPAGINIYPEDVESAINNIDGVRDSCVIGIETKKKEEIHAVLLISGKAGAKQIIAKANKELDASQKIQDYTVWPYEDFPRTTTLKVKKFIVKEFVQNKVKPEGIVEKKNKVYAILSRLTSKKISRNSNLQELGLSSIDRVELVSLLEQEFNLEIDEEDILPGTRVRELENLVKTQKRIEQKIIFRKWALSPLTSCIRFIVQRLLLFPFVSLFSCLSVEGKDNLRDVKGPVIFASNHQSHIDTPAILMKLPLRFSKKTATAALQEYFLGPDMEVKSSGKRILLYLLTAFFNIYLFPQKKGFRRSMKHTGDLIDKGWNILIFPEGKRSEKILKFKQGIGLLAVEMKVPVVPVKIEGTIKILSRDKRWPSFGKARVKIGKPLVIEDESYIGAASIIEKAVRDL